MNNYIINFTEPARNDLKCIKEFLDSRSLEASLNVLKYIFVQIEVLIPQNPQIGRKGKVLRTRELILTKYPYIIVYQVKNSELLILRILHTSRKWPTS